MREVWRARDTWLNRRVAIKVLPAELADDAKLQARFQREARAYFSKECSIYAVPVPTMDGRASRGCSSWRAKGSADSILSPTDAFSCCSAAPPAPCGRFT